MSLRLQSPFSLSGPLPFRRASDTTWGQVWELTGLETSWGWRRRVCEAGTWAQSSELSFLMRKEGYPVHMLSEE